MATPTIASPVGIDVPIQNLQQKFASELFTGTTYASYGRCQLVEDVPKVWDGNTYQDLLLNDRIAGLSFFNVTQTEQVGYQSKANVDIVFFVNLNKLSNLTTRAEQEIIKQVHDILRLEPYGFKLISTVFGEKSVDFKGVKVKDNLQPYFYFKLQTELIFETNFC